MGSSQSPILLDCGQRKDIKFLTSSFYKGFTYSCATEHFTSSGIYKSSMRDEFIDTSWRSADDFVVNVPSTVAITVCRSNGKELTVEASRVLNSCSDHHDQLIANALNVETSAATVGKSVSQVLFTTSRHNELLGLTRIVLQSYATCRLDESINWRDNLVPTRPGTCQMVHRHRLTSGRYSPVVVAASILGSNGIVENENKQNNFEIFIDHLDDNDKLE